MSSKMEYFYILALLLVTNFNGILCECDTGYVSNEAGTDCLPYATEYHDACSEDAQCKWLGINSQCLYNVVCGCQENYVWYQGSCQKYSRLSESCENNEICYDGYNFRSLACNSEHRCDCNAGEHYYRRGDSDCRKEANEGASCALDIDCHFDNSACILGKCVRSSKMFSKEDITVEEIEIYETPQIQTFDVKTCSVDADCTEKNTFCFPDTLTCTCKRGYFLQNDECIEEIGVANGCSNDTDCPLRPGFCDKNTGTCFCRDYYFVEDGNRNCIKTMSQTNWNCLSKEWCFALGQYSYCSNEGICSCSHNSELNDEQYLCSEPSDLPEDFCDNNYICESKFRNGQCIDEKCGCQVGYRLDNETETERCLPNLGSECDDNMPCTIENAGCDNSICKCSANFVGDTSDNNATYEKCYPISTLGEQCEKDIQCAASDAFAICADNTCTCDEDSVEYERSCYLRKKFGDYCTTTLQCTISLDDTYKCRNSKCQCPTGSKLNKETCSSSNRIYGSMVVISLLFIVKATISIIC